MELFNTKKSIEASTVLKGSVDAHCHILFGVDDGISTLEESLIALDYEASLGVRKVYCTPHIMEEVENSSEALKSRFSELKAAYSGPVELELAAEYMLDSVFDERLAARDLLTRDDDMVMVETRAGQGPFNFEGTLSQIRSAGYHVLLAHPERYFYLEKKDYERLFNNGIRFQMNIPSLCKEYGPIPYEKAIWMLEKGMYWCIGSDCHRIKRIQRQYSEKYLTKSAEKNLRKLIEQES